MRAVFPRANKIDPAMLLVGERIKREGKSLKEPQVDHLARHGETAWSCSGQRTGLTDPPLTKRGECDARRLGERLKGLEFARVFASPLQRAKRAGELAGFGSKAEVDRDLVEWNYSEYVGPTSADICAKRPGWEIFRDGFPAGDSFDQIGARADRVVARVRSIRRCCSSRWRGLKLEGVHYFLLSTASLSTLTHEHNPSEPAIGLWNDTRHVSAQCLESR